MQGLLRSCRRLPRARRHVEALASWRCTSFACRWQHASAALDDNEAAAAGSAGPLALYEAAVSRGKYRSDPQQLVAVHKLQRLWSEVAGGSAQSQLPSTSGLTLVDAMDEGTPARWKLWSLLTGGGSSEQPSSESALHVRGLYLYGGVGAGKTMLMDLFYDALPPGMRKKRIHFHDFMLDVHRRLRELKAVADPLHAVAESFTRSRGGVATGTSIVLCLDEFMVTDVADAMILKRLFQHLFDDGLVLVSTSNRAPDKLYEGGLQRSLFLPFIALLKQRCEVHDIQGAQDYRMLARKLATPLYFTGPKASTELQCVLRVLAPGLAAQPVTIDVAMGRTLRVPLAAGQVAFFSFSALCDQPVAAADYIALCQRFHTILIDGVPRFAVESRAAAHRLVTLVDVAYELRVRLVFTAAGPPSELFSCIMTQADYRAVAATTSGHTKDDICVDDNVGFAKDRTISRITEMGTLPYAREHAVRYAPELLPSLPTDEAVV